jgi:tRNA (cytidine/uridine-2'-O-)-methyltransferase
MLNVVLFQPEIPPNTGNIIRLAANSGATLTLIEPLGFEFSDSRLKRAGLDYHQWAEVRLCKNFDEFLDTTDETRLFGFSTRGNRLYDHVRYRKGDSLLFGPETRGLPDTIIQRLGSRAVRIPMQKSSRSLNLANAVAIGLFEAWRQLGFDGGK